MVVFMGEIETLKIRLELSHEREKRLQKLICVLCIILNDTVFKQSRD